MDEIKNLTNRLLAFRDERDWAQFHNPKDLAIAISIEAGELLELFLWKSPEEGNKERAAMEIADIISFCFLFANQYGFDITEIVTDKIRENELKYPVAKAKGNAKKYNELY